MSNNDKSRDDDWGVTPTEDGWQVRVARRNPRTGELVNRKLTFKRSETTYAGVLAARDALVEEIRTGEKPNSDDPTLGAYAASWLGLKVPRLPSKTTGYRYADEVRLHILGEYSDPKICLGKLRVRAIVKNDLDTWFKAFQQADASDLRWQARQRQRDKTNKKRIEAGKTALPPVPRMKPSSYSPRYINGHWRTLKQILQDAVVGLRLPFDPTMKIEPLYEPKRPRAKKNVLEGWEVCLLLDHAREHQPYWHAFMFLGFHLGLRLGELRPLRWKEDIDLDAATLLVQQSQRGDYLGETKGKEDRATSLPEEFLQVLRAHKEWLRLHHPGYKSGLVFPGYGKWRPWHKTRPLQQEVLFLSKGSFDAPLKEMCKAVGIDKFVTTHVMRRTFNTAGDALKIEASIIRSFTGHKTEEMRMLYTDVTDPRRTEALAKVAELYRSKR